MRSTNVCRYVSDRLGMNASLTGFKLLTLADSKRLTRMSSQADTWELILERRFGETLQGLSKCKMERLSHFTPSS